MTTVTTRNQQTKIGSAVRRVGGINRFKALTAAKKALSREVLRGQTAEIHQTPDGQWVVKKAERRPYRGQITGKIQAGTPD